MEKINIELQNANQRIDRYLTEVLEDLSRSQIQKMIKDGLVQVNNQNIKPNYRLEEGDMITYEIPSFEVDLSPSKEALDIIYEDDDLLIVNKPAGLIVHPAESNQGSETLVHRLLAYCPETLSDIGGPLRPGVVHRLDKDTSGLLVIAKNNESHEKLVEMFKNREVLREYYVLVEGHFNHQHAHVDAPIGRDPQNRQKMKVTHINAKEARTDFFAEEIYDDLSLLVARLDTGRTHQIRLHSLFMELPVLGDDLYGSGEVEELEGQGLHAYHLAFAHPITGEKMEFFTEIPKRFERVLRKVRSEKP